MKEPVILIRQTAVLEREDNKIFINMIKILENFNTNERRQYVTHAFLSKICSLRINLYLKYGWKKASREDLIKFTEKTIIRCFVSGCGCMGQQVVLDPKYHVNNRIAYLFHKGHHNPIARMSTLKPYRWIFEDGCFGKILVRKVDFPK